MEQAGTVFPMKTISSALNCSGQSNTEETKQTKKKKPTQVEACLKFAADDFGQVSEIQSAPMRPKQRSLGAIAHTAFRGMLLLYIIPRKSMSKPSRCWVSESISYWQTSNNREKDEWRTAPGCSS